MIGSKILPIIICVFFVGCAQHVKISPRKCLAPKARWALESDSDKFRYRYHIRIDDQYTLLKNVLKAKKADCGDLDTIHITHKYTWKDVIWNMVPFVGRSTLIVSGSASTSKSSQ
jgi:hypothetical protein